MDSIPIENNQMWEQRHDEDGFVYKILKCRSASSETSREVPREDLNKRRSKREALLSLRSQYQEEIDQWTKLSNFLNDLREKAIHETESRSCVPYQDSDKSSPSDDPVLPQTNSEENSCAELNQLLLQLDTQEATIRNVSNLCELAESICHSHEQRLVQSFIDLPIWSSPRELLASLCED